MENKTKLLFKGYLELSVTEKKLLEEEITKYNSKGTFGKETFNESFNKSLGPILGAKCSVCGK
ncbi:hypothetical protein [Tenacibaculum aiptasiae]|uniref:hypothetical protein n=1 Tax=Tenacibaculum aiptasiae TaxID=426481 RepID=UPI00233117BE|nr:hypothetical protein [Tenacibaculum aiptasiae]